MIATIIISKLTTKHEQRNIFTAISEQQKRRINHWDQSLTKFRRKTKTKKTIELE